MKSKISREEALDLLQKYNKAVSYTHLDVYKRQEYCRTTETTGRSGLSG